MSHETLKAEIISKSAAQDWEAARREWAVQSILLAEDPSSCLCKHSPIYELCFIENTVTRTVVVVGNRCVQKFMGLPSRNLFAGLKRIKVNAEKSMNRAMIELARGKGWLTEWEHAFCVDTRLKRKLTQSQSEKRSEINRRVLGYCVGRRNPAGAMPASLAS